MKLLGKWKYLLLLMTMVLLTAGTANIANADVLTSLQGGADHLVTLQNADGGWPWLTTGPSALNIIAPTTLGVVPALSLTGGASYLTSLTNAGTYLLAKTNNFSPSDGYLAYILDNAFHVTTYKNHLNTNYYGPLAAGTYDKNGVDTNYTTATYIDAIQLARHSAGQGNIAAWDLGMGLVAANLCGVTGTELNAWKQGVKDEINLLDGTQYYDVIGLAGAIAGLAAVGENFDPTAGEHAAASSLNDLAAILATYQINSGAGAGGFTWSKNAMAPDAYNETIQETAYAILALNNVDPAKYALNVQNAANYMMNVQLPSGGWLPYQDTSDATNVEYPEVDGEALWGIYNATTNQLVSDYGTQGLWYFNDSIGAWSQIDAGNATTTAFYNGKLYVAFDGGGPAGLWEYNGVTLIQRSSTTPSVLCASGGYLYVTYPGYGLYKYDGVTQPMTKIGSTVPSDMIAVGSGLLVSYPGYGLYGYNGVTQPMTKLCNDLPTTMVSAFGSYGFAAFTGNGMWKYDGNALTLTKIGIVTPSVMVQSGSYLYVAFPGYGLYKYDNVTQPMTKIGSTVPSQMTAFGSSSLLLTYPGYGLYKYDGVTQPMTKLGNILPDRMLGCGGSVFLDFLSYGLYKYDGVTQPMTSITKPVTNVSDQMINVKFNR